MRRLLIVNRLGPDAGRYYLPGPVTGRWCGGGRHALGLDGPVTAAGLDAVLHGRGPDGHVLSTRRVAHRRGGWDLIFTAPKSVSLVAAASGGEEVAGAHLRACADAFVWLERHGSWARRRNALVETSGFVAARFGHHLSASGEPHLHTHVLVANVVCAGDGAWSAVDSSALWRTRRAVAAVYHLGLRRHLAAAGIHASWTVHDDGTADLADVPRAAIDATSTRRRQIHAHLAPGADASPQHRIAAQRTTREEPGEDSAWTERAAAAGFGPDAAAALLRSTTPLASPAAEPPERLAAGVVAWLDRRRSTFGLVDVMQALAATHTAGAAPDDVHRWAETFLAGSPRARDGRWTSGLSMAHDAALAAGVAGRAGAGVAVVGPDALLAAGVVGSAALLVGSGNGVDVLAGPPPDPESWPVTRVNGGFVAQAAALDAARVAWQREGYTVAVDAPGESASRRWRALAGLGRAAPGGRLPDVLVVDRADRRTSAELAAVLDAAAATGSKVVLVRGGTLPARRVAVSQALEASARELGPVVPAPEGITPGLGPPGPAERPGSPTDPSRAPTMAVAAAWSAQRRAGVAARMVGLGPAECDELNRRAREWSRGEGALGEREVTVAGRPFAVGDEVVMTRRGSLPAGTWGWVERLIGERGLVVASELGSVEMDRWSGRSLRHGYAVPPGMLRFDDTPVVVLGRAEDLGRHAGRVVGHARVADGMEQDRSSDRTLERRTNHHLVDDQVGDVMLERRGRGRTSPTAERARTREPPELGLGL